MRTVARYISFGREAPRVPLIGVITEGNVIWRAIWR